MANYFKFYLDQGIAKTIYPDDNDPHTNGTKSYLKLGSLSGKMVDDFLLKHSPELYRIPYSKVTLPLMTSVWPCKKLANLIKKLPVYCNSVKYDVVGKDQILILRLRCKVIDKYMFDAIDLGSRYIYPSYSPYIPIAAKFKGDPNKLYMPRFPLYFNAHIVEPLKTSDLNTRIIY